MATCDGMIDLQARLYSLGAASSGADPTTCRNPLAIRAGMMSLLHLCISLMNPAVCRHQDHSVCEDGNG